MMQAVYGRGFGGSALDLTVLSLILCEIKYQNNEIGDCYSQNLVAFFCFGFAP